MIRAALACALLAPAVALADCPVPGAGEAFTLISEGPPRTRTTVRPAASADDPVVMLSRASEVTDLRASAKTYRGLFPIHLMIGHFYTIARYDPPLAELFPLEAGQTATLFVENNVDGSLLRQRAIIEVGAPVPFEIGDCTYETLVLDFAWASQAEDGAPWEPTYQDRWFYAPGLGVTLGRIVHDDADRQITPAEFSYDRITTRVADMVPE